MYDTNYPNDENMDSWVKGKLEKVMKNMSSMEPFWIYILSKWVSKTYVACGVLKLALCWTKHKYCD
jgi:hypothetical protein